MITVHYKSFWAPRYAVSCLYPNNSTTCLLLYIATKGWPNCFRQKQYTNTYIIYSTFTKNCFILSKDTSWYITESVTSRTFAEHIPENVSSVMFASEQLTAYSIICWNVFFVFSSLSLWIGWTTWSHSPANCAPPSRLLAYNGDIKSTNFYVFGLQLLLTSSLIPQQTSRRRGLWRTKRPTTSGWIVGSREIFDNGIIIRVQHRNHQGVTAWNIVSDGHVA